MPRIALIMTMLVGLVPRATSAQTPSPPCDSVPGFHALDFWVGEWKVVDPTGASTFGENTIGKILDGCAITEQWRSASGGRGMSLFYFNPMTETWKQVWVTATATRTGGVKEKELVETLEDGALRFQGEVPLPDGKTYLGRTTLTPLAHGVVRQHIEYSTDAGLTWQTSFDAHYLPQRE